MTKDTWAKGLTLIYAAHTNLKKPTSDIAGAWFAWLKHIPDDIFMMAVKEIAMKPGYPPQNLLGELRAVCERIAGKFTLEQAYSIIKDMFDRFYSPEFNSCAGQIICDKLAKQGYSDLIPFAETWGLEIAYAQNPTATRAQFIKSYEAEKQLMQTRKALQTQKAKKLSQPAREAKPIGQLLRIKNQKQKPHKKKTAGKSEDN